MRSSITRFSRQPHVTGDAHTRFERHMARTPVAPPRPYPRFATRARTFAYARRRTAKNRAIMAAPVISHETG